VPSLPKVALAVTGTVIGAALAYPPSRRHAVRTARVAMDELLLRADNPWSEGLLLLTTEGHRSHLPRTTVLSRVEIDGDIYVMPWQTSAHWFANVAKNPDVVVDDRKQVRRARAEVVTGEVAETVRAKFMRENIPGLVHGLLDRAGALGPGMPAVRLTRR
jgi:deazaflavin-dependent oxidoreductase (nitroreductase family)